MSPEIQTTSTICCGHVAKHQTIFAYLRRIVVVSAHTIAPKFVEQRVLLNPPVFCFFFAVGNMCTHVPAFGPT